MNVSAIVLAHNEARRISVCLNSLLAEAGDFLIHVVVNGSSDDTAAIAQRFGEPVQVHVFEKGGKARSWNRFVLDEMRDLADVMVFVDGDAELAHGSVAALVQALADNPAANASAGQPLNGRNAAHYRTEQMRMHGLFGDLYALRGDFLARMRRAGIRLPEDLIGDDSLIGALAKTDLGNEDYWSDARIIVCPDAGFLCEPINLFAPQMWTKQYRRMVSYSVRHFQNRIVSAIMRGAGPTALPTRMADLYADWLPRLSPREGWRDAWFDRRALARMRWSEGYARSVPAKESAAVFVGEARDHTE